MDSAFENVRATKLYGVGTGGGAQTENTASLPGIPQYDQPIVIQSLQPIRPVEATII